MTVATLALGPGPGIAWFAVPLRHLVQDVARSGSVQLENAGLQGARLHCLRFGSGQLANTEVGKPRRMRPAGAHPSVAPAADNGNWALCL